MVRISKDTQNKVQLQFLESFVIKARISAESANNKWKPTADRLRSIISTALQAPSLGIYRTGRVIQ